MLTRLAASSPFKSRANGGVLVYEVDWKHVVGMDYSNPLCLPGRVVLEARQVMKREFLRVSAAFAPSHSANTAEMNMLDHSKIDASYSASLSSSPQHAGCISGNKHALCACEAQNSV